VRTSGRGAAVTRAARRGLRTAVGDAEGEIDTVLVKLDEGVRVPGLLTDCDPHVPGRGDWVEAVVRRIYSQEDVVRYGAKFRPLGR
jgi:uncharacterized OB-fold protein